MNETPSLKGLRRLSAIASSLLIAACASTGGGMQSQTTPATGTPSSTSPTATTTASTPASQQIAWRVSTLEHVDLWLHGFALLTSDTGRVPFFARGYKQQVTALKRQRNIFSQLDANQQDLSARFGTNPALANAQFVAMYFQSFQEIVNATDLLIRSNGNPRASNDPQIQQEIYLLAQNFPTPADRNWLRLFVQSLQDESTRFYHQYWTGEQTTRGAAFAAFQEAWLSKWYPKLSRFLNNTQQSGGRLVLSIPLGGEGRTVNDGKQSNMIAVAYPTTVAAAPEALFTFVHEVVATLVDESVRDNVTPAEARSGASAGYTGNGAVRGGALLLQRVAPELVQEYMRFYLRTMNVTPPTGDASALFASSFPLPPAIVTALGKQIDVVLGGI